MRTWKAQQEVDEISPDLLHLAGVHQPQAQEGL